MTDPGETSGFGDEIILRIAEEEEFPALAALSAEARWRYRGLPAFAYVADTPPVSKDRFQAGRSIIASRHGAIVGLR